MHDRLDDLDQEFLDVEARLADPDLLADQGRYSEVAKRYKELEAIVTRARDLRSAIADLAAAREMYNDASAEDREELRSEIDESTARIDRLDAEIKLLLLPRDPNDGKNVILEVRGAEGGEEANLFARDLFEMYRAYAARMGWRFEVLAASPSDMGGFSEVTCVVSGDGVWTRLKHEGGPHRVQRVPETESQGRIHTSSATVTVLPEAEEVDITIDPNDLQIDVYRSSGPGGQSVNTTDSAVRITHKPTGTVVAMQDEKSQIQNRAKALQVLRSRLLKLEQDKQAAELSDARRGQVGGGGRSEKIRTYNFKENRVTDHRIGLTLYKLDKILAGELDDVVDALVADERSRQLQDATSSYGDGTIAWRALEAEAVGRLAEAGVDHPEVDARWIVQEASGFEGANYVLGRDQPATVRGVAAFDRLLARRLAGEPLQYVLGRWGFRTLDLMVDRRVLIPRPETEQVVGFALAELDRLAARRPGATLVVADLGTGSGAIALSIAAERSRTAVWATDASAEALAVASANLAGLGSAAARVRVAEGSWFEALPPELAGTLDLVVSNPPYVAASDPLPPEVADWEPAGALVSGPTGLEALGELVASAPRWLRRPGVLVVELAPDQAGAVADAARRAGFDDVRREPDLSGRHRAVVARISG